MDKPLVAINYKLANGKRICIDVSDEVKSLLEQTDRQIRSQRRQDRRHLDFVESMDELDALPMQPQEDTADLAIMMDSQKQLYVAMEKLSEAHRRRVYLYYFCGLTYRQIADMDGVHHTTVMRAVEQARKALKKLLEQ